jgi:hypothetical protein
MKNLTDRINDIFNIILEIKQDDPGAAEILAEGLDMSIKLIEQVVLNQGKGQIDVSEKIEIVSNVLGFSLPDLVTHVLKQQQEDSMNTDKQVDQDTLDFITSDLDDYDKFIAQANAKTDIDFLSKTI